MSPSGLNFQFPIITNIDISSDKACFEAPEKHYYMVIIHQLLYFLWLLKNGIIFPKSSAYFATFFKIIF